MSTAHLRGRVRIIGYIKPSRRPVYEWAVVNHATGQVVASDNSCRDSVGDACNEAASMTLTCRETLTREIRLKSLREVP
jgi:hypothetical protein